MGEFENLKAFEHHGVRFERLVGNQGVGYCPFCEKEDHFYAHVEKKLWDCKRCGRKGNLGQFLEQIAEENVQGLTAKLWARLAVDRRLPLSALAGWGLGWDGTRYTLPVRNLNGMVVDLRTFQIGGKFRATSGATLGLLGAEDLKENDGRVVYICEGEGDAFALRWLARKLEKKIVVVAVPGASVFKQEWFAWFAGRSVVACHDHDAAGDAGRKKVVTSLSGFAASVKEIVWPDALPDGFDLRDLVAEEAVKNRRPRAAWAKLQAMLEAPVAALVALKPTGEPVQPTVNGHVDASDVFDAYKKWLHLSSDESLRVMFGAVFANKMQGDPIWLFLVAPPGGSKSELLSSMSRNPIIEATTALTPHSLVSGAANFNGQDPSLLPKLNGRILVIKDFTTILTMHFSSRDEIFGILRDAYDGSTTKTFGTGLKRTYHSHFGIIAGVTPKIEEFGVVHQSLGERFLKYRINTGQKTLSEADRIRRALSNINQESAMRDDLCTAANLVLGQPLPAVLPTIPPQVFEYVINLAQCCAMMRGVVDRDRYTQQVHYRPSIEVGTRLAKQLAKLGIGIAIYLNRPTVDLEIYKIIRKVALDTAPDRIEAIVRHLWKRTANPDLTLNTAELSASTRLPIATCFRVLQDLDLLKVVDRIGTGNKYAWKVNERMLKLIDGGIVYEGRKP